MDISSSYNLVKALHIIFMTTWMAGLFYLPRIFVYHSETKKNTRQYKTFNTMERKLYNYIMNPSLVGTWVFGILLTLITDSYQAIWINLKLVLIFFLTLFHIYCGKNIQTFKKGQNNHSGKFFRMINEIPTILFIAIIFIVIFKPFN